jgi:hypothetical protein
MNIETNDKLDLMISLVAKDCGNDDVEMLDSLDTYQVVLDKHFYRKRDRIVAKQKHYPAILILKKGLLRVAVALLIIMSLGFTTVMAITPLREALFEAVIEWYEDYLTIRYEPTENGESNAEEGKENGEEDNSSPDVPVITPPAIIEEVRKPTYILEGMVEDIVLQNKAMVYIDYYLNDELLYTFNQMLLSEREKYLDNVGVEVTTININGHEGIVFESVETNGLSVVWSDNEYVYHVITQTTDLEEIIIFCQSVG